MATKRKHIDKLTAVGFLANLCAILALAIAVGMMVVLNMFGGRGVGLASISSPLQNSCSCKNTNDMCSLTAMPSVLFPITSEAPLETPAAISMDDSGFSKASIDMTYSSSKKMEIANKGVNPHSFVIEELGVDSGPIKPGETKTIILENLPSVGQDYVFYSNIPGDAKEKFSGTIVIKPLEPSQGVGEEGGAEK